MFTWLKKNGLFIATMVGLLFRLSLIFYSLWYLFTNILFIDVSFTYLTVTTLVANLYVSDSYNDD